MKLRVAKKIMGRLWGSEASPYKRSTLGRAIARMQKRLDRNKCQYDDIQIYLEGLRNRQVW